MSPSHSKQILIRSFLILALIVSGNLSELLAQDDKIVLDLSGPWGMEGVLPGEGVKKDFHLEKPDAGSAIVPGDVY